MLRMCITHRVLFILSSSGSTIENMSHLKLTKAAIYGGEKRNSHSLCDKMCQYNVGVAYDVVRCSRVWDIDLQAENQYSHWDDCLSVVSDFLCFIFGWTKTLVYAVIRYIITIYTNIDMIDMRHEGEFNEKSQFSVDTIYSPCEIVSNCKAFYLENNLHRIASVRFGR